MGEIVGFPAPSRVTCPEFRARLATEAAEKKAESVIAGMVLVWIPPGEFRMGSTSVEAAANEGTANPWLLSRQVRGHSGAVEDRHKQATRR